MSRQGPSLPSLEQYAKLLSARDDEELSEHKVASEAAPKALGRLRLPVSKSLMTLTKKSTNPVARKGRVPRRRTWRDLTAGDAVNYGVKAWNLAKHLATLINVENKTWDVDGSGGTTITSTALVANLSNIAQGNDYGNRNGDSILCQSLEFRATVLTNNAAASHGLRVLIVSDRLQRGVDPVIGDVLQGGTDPIEQPYLEPQEGRFDVLYDHVMSLNSQGAGLASSGTSTTYIGSQHTLPTMIRKWNRHIKYQNTTGADASNWIGGLYLIAISRDATNGPQLRYTFRIRFTDN